MEWGMHYETRQAQAVAKARDQARIEIEQAWQNVDRERFVELYSDRGIFERSWRQTARDVARVEGIPAGVLPDYLEAFWAAVDEWAKARIAEPVRQQLRLERQVTVGELVDFLSTLPRERGVYTEGCDCTGKSNGAEVDRDGDVVVLRWGDE